MPTYEYECVGCHEVRQVTASIFDKVADQFCGFDGNKMYKVYTSPGVIWNAKGFAGRKG